MLQDIDLSKMFTTQKISDNQIIIKSEASFFDATPLEILLIQDKDEMFLSDNKSTIKYMNKLYELSASDVKKCISSLIKAYSLKMRGGEIICPVSSVEKLPENILELIQCSTQMANMFIFFDKPE